MPCVDLYQVFFFRFDHLFFLIHGSAFSIRSIETWAEALADAKERGEIKEIGNTSFLYVFFNCVFKAFRIIALVK